LSRRFRRRQIRQENNKMQDFKIGQNGRNFRVMPLSQRAKEFIKTYTESASDSDDAPIINVSQRSILDLITSLQLLGFEVEIFTAPTNLKKGETS
jgi:hypothetical protein